MPVGVLGHLEFCLDLIERFTLRRHLTHPFEQQGIIPFVLVEDFRRRQLTVAGTTTSGFNDFISL